MTNVSNLTTKWLCQQLQYNGACLCDWEHKCYYVSIIIIYKSIWRAWSANVHDWFLCHIHHLYPIFFHFISCNYPFLCTQLSALWSWVCVSVCVVVINCKEIHWAVCQIATSQSYDSPQNKFNPSGSVTQPLKQNKLTYTQKNTHMHPSKLTHLDPGQIQRRMCCLSFCSIGDTTKLNYILKNSENNNNEAFIF